MVNELVDVRAALAKGRDVERYGADAEIEIAAESAGGDLLLEVAVGERDQADVDLAGLAVAQAVDGAFLEGAEKVGLKVEREFADFVQAKGAAMGELEAAGAAVSRCSGEGAGDVAEQLGAEQVLGDGAAVERDERGVRVLLAGIVDELREQLLADAGFAFDQDGDAAGCCRFALVMACSRRSLRPSISGSGRAGGVMVGLGGFALVRARPAAAV